jgi:hypothetical protein
VSGIPTAALVSRLAVTGLTACLAASYAPISVIRLSEEFPKS